MKAAFIYSEELWSREFSKGYPLVPERLKCTYELLAACRAYAKQNVAAIKAHTKDVWHWE